MRIEDVLKKPLLTEKSTLMTETTNRYGFLVNKDANKFQIKQAVETLYDVKVLNVRTAVIAGKTRRFGRFVSKAPSYKKAFVKLADSQKIEFFKGI